MATKFGDLTNASAIDGTERVPVIQGDNARSASIAATRALTINAQTGTTYTLVETDVQKLVTLTNAAGITCTLPQDSDATFPVGSFVDFAQLGAGQVTFAAGSGATVNSTPGLKISAQYGTARAVKRAANTWIVSGSLSA